MKDMMNFVPSFGHTVPKITWWGNLKAILLVFRKQQKSRCNVNQPHKFLSRLISNMPKPLTAIMKRLPFMRKSGNFTKMKSGTERLICKERWRMWVKNNFKVEAEKGTKAIWKIILVQNENVEKQIFKR